MIDAVILVFMGLMIVFGILLSFKCNNAFKNQWKILEAISNYIDETEEYRIAMLILTNMKSIPKTIFRLWDWGYKNILPKEDFELIKPYIKEK